MTVQLHSGDVVLVVAVFFASAVEGVEALTIVLAVGVTRGWRSALEGLAAALVVLAALVALLGPALVHYVPLSTLRLVVGGLLLVFGLQWVRKAVLRAAGLMAKHDEDAIYARQVAALSTGAGGAAARPGRPARPARPGRERDPTAFVVAFKGVFLEGLEVVVVVVTLGSTSHRLGLAAVVAALAVVVVGAVGLVVARQLSAVPENALKMGVGLMLVSFGTFWSGEGVGVHWPGSDLAIPVLVAVYGALAWALTAAVRPSPAAGAATTAGGGGAR
ncbi:MAG: hypothetical protein ACLQOZ_08260 [Acidimicrobiales bacterium]